MLALLLAAATVAVPAGAPVTLDGIVAPAEWDDAAVVPLSDGFTLHLGDRSIVWPAGTHEFRPHVRAAIRLP